MRTPFTAGRARQSGGDDRAGGDAPVLLNAPQTSFEVYNSPHDTLARLVNHT